MYQIWDCWINSLNIRVQIFESLLSATLTKIRTEIVGGRMEFYVRDRWSFTIKALA